MGVDSGIRHLVNGNVLSDVLVSDRWKSVTAAGNGK